MDLKSLFKLTPEKTVAPSSQKDAVAAAVQQNTEAKQEGETYTNYGRRICGLVNAASQALTPFLNKIFVQEKKQQQDDTALQQQLKQRIANEITDAQTEKRKHENDLCDLQTQQEDTKQKIEGYREEINELKKKIDTDNKEARIKMILGIIILIPLTIYLFMFYSSTIYMGFISIKNASGLSSAMFNPQALSNAWNDGIPEFCFVLLMPMIFLALGFLLHFFSAKKDVKGYIQAALIILITFLFDCILAYKIGDVMYGTTWATAPYSISKAVTDINTWAVIFCGFIAYIIWGLVFDLAITGYEDMTSNKRQIETINLKIDNESERGKELNNQITQLKNKIIELEGEIKKKQIGLANNFIYSIDAIKQAFYDFFSGWIVMMKALGKSQSEMQEANNIYNQTVQQLFNKTEK